MSESSAFIPRPALIPLITFSVLFPKYPSPANFPLVNLLKASESSVFIFPVNLESISFWIFSTVLSDLDPTSVFLRVLENPIDFFFSPISSSFFFPSSSSFFFPSSADFSVAFLATYSEFFSVAAVKSSVALVKSRAASLAVSF